MRPSENILTAYAAAHPDKVGVIDDRSDGDVVTLSYAKSRALRIASPMLGLGVLPNTKVVWCGRTRSVFITMVNTARKIGATAVPLNYRLSDEEAAYVTDHSDAELVYVDAEYAPMFERIHGQLPKVATYLVYDGEAPAGME